MTDKHIWLATNFSGDKGATVFVGPDLPCTTLEYFQQHKSMMNGVNTPLYLVIEFGSGRVVSGPDNTEPVGEDEENADQTRAKQRQTKGSGSTGNQTKLKQEKKGKKTLIKSEKIKEEQDKGEQSSRRSRAKGKTIKQKKMVPIRHKRGISQVEVETPQVEDTDNQIDGVNADTDLVKSELVQTEYFSDDGSELTAEETLPEAEDIFGMHTRSKGRLPIEES